MPFIIFNSFIVSVYSGFACKPRTVKLTIFPFYNRVFCAFWVNCIPQFVLQEEEKRRTREKMPSSNDDNCPGAKIGMCVMVVRSFFILLSVLPDRTFCEPRVMENKFHAFRNNDMRAQWLLYFEMFLRVWLGGQPVQIFILMTCVSDFFINTV